MAQYFNEGMVIMRFQLQRDMYQNYFNLTVNQGVFLNIITSIPNLIKIFLGLVVDARVVSNRKHILIFFGLLQAVLEGIIASRFLDDVNKVAALIFIINFGTIILEVTMESILVQQARKNSMYG